MTHTATGADTLPAVIRFGCCELLPHHRELRVDGKVAPLGGRAFDLLLVLIEGRGKLVTKDEILNRVWPGVIIEENTLQVQVSTLRKALGADRDSLKTISGRGYRFTAEVAATSAQAAVVLEHADVSHDALEISTGLQATPGRVVERETDVARVLDLIGVAVELAAACLPAFRVAELARQLDDRLRPLRSGQRAALSRHPREVQHV